MVPPKSVLLKNCHSKKNLTSQRSQYIYISLYIQKNVYIYIYKKISPNILKYHLISHKIYETIWNNMEQSSILTSCSQRFLLQLTAAGRSESCCLAPRLHFATLALVLASHCRSSLEPVACTLGRTSAGCACCTPRLQAGCQPLARDIVPHLWIARMIHHLGQPFADLSPRGQAFSDSSESAPEVGDGSATSLTSWLGQSQRWCGPRWLDPLSPRSWWKESELEQSEAVSAKRHGYWSACRDRLLCPWSGGTEHSWPSQACTGSFCAPMSGAHGYVSPWPCRRTGCGVCRYHLSSSPTSFAPPSHLTQRAWRARVQQRTSFARASGQSVWCRSALQSFCTPHRLAHRLGPSKPPASGSLRALW